SGPFAFADLVAGDADMTPPSFGIRRIPGWKIQFADHVPAAIAARLPRHARYGRVVDRFGLWPSVAAFGVVAALLIAGVLNAPPLLARMIPSSVEQRIGTIMIGDFGRNGCADPAGEAALQALLQRIDPDDAAIEVSVVKLPMVNAVTLPGGRIVIFDGLLADAKSPDEVAGVIGHEIGHIRHHDVMESLLRQLGLSVVLGGLEGHVGGYTNALLATAYSRGAEGRADGYAIDLMREAKISPQPTAAFFARLGKGAGKAERMLSYLATHPVSADRAARFRAAVKPVAYRPALDATQWHALRSICRATKGEQGWRF
ncbi:MAG: M48 family metallopeptidase, partial [Sphingomonas sp.]